MKRRGYTLFIILFLLLSIVNVNALEKKKIKVLVIEINPILKTIQNKNLYKNNNGHPYVSEYFGFDRNLALKELKYDLESMSHDYIEIEIVKNEHLNEFPTYKKKIDLIDGNKAYKYDEKTYLAISRSSENKDKGNWLDFIYYPNNKPESYSFDYDYLIRKFNLIERRNNGEFDQVWLNTIDPSSTFETVMVGSRPYWINGTPIERDCKNFMILNISISRRDANLHALSHGIEGVMSMVFNNTWFNYKITYEDATEEEYEKLNLWQKYTITNKQSKGNHAGVGNVHFPFNGTSDYDYTNKTKVYSNWENWLNYPDISGKSKKSNSDAWLKFDKNLELGKNQNKDPDRLYIRFWLYLFPHIKGYTEDGYDNNWWNYFATFDFVDTIDSNMDLIFKIDKGDEVVLDYTLNYYSGDSEVVKKVEDDLNVHITGDSIKFVDGKLKAVELGKSTLSIYRDGKSITYEIEVIHNTFERALNGIAVFLLIILVFALVMYFIKKKNKQ